ncbi:hypothetical protein AKI39_12150 [Bordetella sp. H567]|uniref:hypothetical protein n=1 Tax=Bordetella sp. H567 TaxID=1697043 RepID=UPI00081C423A|nr:hypothetical protein [Bordetella sp. H567]AOB31283.1 hypothetical protein AKI39_12150 [Bordetella sp. H567]
MPDSAARQDAHALMRRKYHLAPGAAGTLRGEPGDKWLNIEMQPGLSIGTTADVQAGSAR